MKSKIEKLKKTLINRKKSLLSSERPSAKIGIDSRKGDDIDLAESAYEQEMTYIMKSRESQELKVIDEALKKINKGEYGICEECGESIEVKRLEAMPFVTYCVNCQSNIEEKSKLDAIGVELSED